MGWNNFKEINLKPRSYYIYHIFNPHNRHLPTCILNGKCYKEHLLQHWNNERWILKSSLLCVWVFFAFGLYGKQFCINIMYIYCLFILFFFTEVRGAASNSAYYGYPELWILRYPAQRYHAVPSPGFEPTTLWLGVWCPNHFCHDAPLFILQTFRQINSNFSLI
jgi:hypothetical protein